MDKKTIYTNAVNMTTSMFDFMLSVGVKHPDNYEDTEYRIYMSPQHAKALSYVLSQNVYNYEQIFGVINLEANADKLEELRKQGLIGEQEVN